MSRKLLFIVNDAGYFLSHRLPIAEAAREAGWQVAVATAKGPAQEAIRAAGFTAHNLPLTRSGLRLDQELRSVIACWRLIRRLEPDLVHCVALKAAVAGGLAARLAGVPAVVLSVAGLGHAFTDGGLGGRLVRQILRALMPLLVSPRTRLIVQNREDLERLASRAAIRARAVLIPGAGVDLERFSPAPEPGSPVTVLLASRMIWKKGVGEFVSAARALRQVDGSWRFLLAGDSDPGNPAAIERAQLEAWNRDGAVEWLGQRDDMPELLGACHVFCLPSYYGEGVPKSLIEAAACGRAAVTTDMPGCRDVVRDGENGFLVAPRDPAALAEALRQLLEDPALRQRFGRRGREIACEHFGLAGVVSATLSLYEELVPAAGVAPGSRLSRPAA